MDAAKTAHELYNDWHDQHGVDTESNAPWHLMIKQHMELDRDLSGKKVLEIGCGRGGFSCWLAAQGNPPGNITAADFSESAVEKGAAFAGSQGIDNVTWLVQDIQDIQFPDNTFDTVLSCETIEHVPDPQKAVRELARVLKPGGRLFLTTPNYMNLLGVYRGYLRLRGRRFTEVGQPINNFTMLPRTCSWVRSAGLRPKVVEAHGHFFPIPGRTSTDMTFFEHVPVVRTWFARHPLIVAVKQ